jgi:molybdopterin molybdotransferase
MNDLTRAASVAEAIDWIDRQISVLPWETVPLDEAAGRVLTFDAKSKFDVPGFDRVMADGFAVLSQDTRAASSKQPVTLEIVGQVQPGQMPSGKLRPGQAVRVSTGAALPNAADAVVRTEDTVEAKTEIRITRPVAAGENVGAKGEDIAAGSLVLRIGRRLRAQDVGILSSLGVNSVEVVRPARVRVVATGNELLPAGATPRGARIPDVNTPMLEALIQRDGGVPVHGPVVPDEPANILAALKDDADVVIVTGGSTPGPEDHAPTLVRRHGELAYHGIAVRPGHRTGMGLLEHRLVFLLPGNPAACLCMYEMFAGRAVRGLAGFPREWPHRRVRLPLARPIRSETGCTELARVQICDGVVEPIAISGSSILSSTTRADGFVVLPEQSEGIEKDVEVEVMLYD